MKLKIYSAVCAFVVALVALPTISGKPAIGEPSGVLVAYEKVSRALAADDLSGAQKSAVILANKGKASGNEAIATHASELAKSVSLEQAREHFKLLSAEAAKLAGQTSGYYVMSCPMAKADWVQSTKQIANPYLGKKMHDCGAIKEKKKS